MKSHDVEIAIIGAGIAGIAAAHFLATRHTLTKLLIVDAGQPMALTSAQSGENYRNWWPHPTMTALTDHSISLLEDIARRTDNGIHMTHRGYLLTTRDAQPDGLRNCIQVTARPQKAPSDFTTARARSAISPPWRRTGKRRQTGSTCCAIAP